MKLIAFDLESGGGSSEFSLLTGCFKILRPNSDLKLIVEDRLYLTIKHDIYKIHPEAMEVNGLNLKEIEANGVSVSKAGELLFKFIKKNGSEEKLIPLGHAITNDIRMVNAQILKENNWNQFVSFKYLDTQVLAMTLQYKGKIPADLSLKLKSLCEYFKLTGFNYHTAEGDTDATISLYEEEVRLI